MKPDPLHIKLVASDVDGTLLNDNFVLSSKTFRVINALQSKGILFVPATGRTYEALSSVVDCTFFKYVICANGVHLYKRENDVMQLVWNKSFQWGDLKVFFELRSRFFPTMHVHLYVGEELITDQYGPFLAEYEQRSGLKFRIVSSFDELKDKEITKIMIIHADEKLQNIQTLLADNGFNVMFSDVHFLEVIDRESSKGRALQQVYQYEALSFNDAMAFGDSFNDVSLLKEVGLPLVMKNANSELLPELARTQFSNDEDGVAQHLIDLFGLTIS